MVKGVKRDIIEVNNTGSECFERIVFYVSPDFKLSGKNVAELAAKELSEIVSGSKDYKTTLRYRVKAKRVKRMIYCVLFAALIIGLTVILKLKG